MAKASQSNQPADNSVASHTRSRLKKNSDPDAMDEDHKVDAGSKRKEDDVEPAEEEIEEEPVSKKAKVGKDGHAHAKKDDDGDDEDDDEPEEPKARSKKSRKASTSKPRTTKAKSKAKDDHEDVDMKDEQDGVLETGHIYFFYRPKVDIGPDDTCSSLDDIAKFYFLMLPRGDSNSKQRFRLFVIGKKRLPDRARGGREVFWATLSSFGDDFAKFKAGDALGEKNYSTKTRGERHIEPARIAGRGHYALFSPHPNTPSQRATHLVYFLTHPSPNEVGSIQKELSIHESDSFIVQIKNPHASNPPQAGLPADKKADYGEELIEEKFGGDADHGTGKRFIAPNPAGMLDFENTEMLLIPEKHDAEEILADEKAEKELEKAASDDAEKLSSQSVLKELRLNEAAFPCDALEGEWL